MNTSIGAEVDPVEVQRQKEIDDAKERVNLTWFFQVLALIAFSFLAYWTSGMWKNHAVWTTILFVIEGLVLAAISLLLFYLRKMAKDDWDEALEDGY